MLAAVTDGHGTQGDGAGGESGGRRHPEARAHLFALVREAQGDGRRLDRPPRRRLEPDDRLGGAAGEAPREHADLDRLARRGQGQRRDVRRDAQGERGHDLQLVPALAADRGPVVAPGDRGAQRGRDAADPAPRAGDQGGRAPGARLVGGNEQLVAVPVLRPAPVGLRRAGVGAIVTAKRARRAPAPASGPVSLSSRSIAQPAGASSSSASTSSPRPALLKRATATPTDWPGVASPSSARASRTRPWASPSALSTSSSSSRRRSATSARATRSAIRPSRLPASSRMAVSISARAGTDASGEAGSRAARARVACACRARSAGAILRGEAREAGDRSVDAVEHVALGAGHGGVRVEEAERPRGRTGVRHDLPDPLAPVQGPGTGAELLPRHPEDRVVDAGRHVDGRARHLPVATDAPLVDLPGLPGPQSLLELPGEPRRVRGGAERLAREPPHRLVVLPPALALEGQGEDHVGAEGADDAHDVPERLLATPLREGLLHAEREPELVGPPEVLLGPVVAVDRHQLPGPKDTEGVEQLGPDRVLAALAAGHGEECGPDAQAAREPHENAVHLVVGVGGHVEDAAGDADLAQGEGEAARPAVEIEGLEGRLGRRERREKAEGRGHGERAEAGLHRGLHRGLAGAFSGRPSPGLSENPRERRPDGRPLGGGAHCSGVSAVSA